ncbi:N-acetyl-gamma-glutamyl-phosphate reductase [Pseudochryseolinea flava]|uniref:N-acetyl-gamma-glutamyl-phosphate reductase n=1 Tax=Pseudochryseolinea flava TaxID=2059302 RepID=A0A364Y4L2_9BACT|nr:N-acetyl-gamma-glutamyl-phosphate reductase [Pseudochryseolinea flava]RAW01716.1 N-acetyl-gamma-glutamyl-phosphate reductase [Pseudochryseolinea flava]
MSNKIKVGIIGGAGYTGGETIRLLINHPQVELVFVHSRSNAGNPLYEAHPDLEGDTDLKFTDSLQHKVDVIFLCLGHGESKKFLQDNPIDASISVIDLSQDFRLGESLPGREFVYGLPELNREAIKKSKNVANPGCFATAIQLGLLPLAKSNALKEVFATGITGSTGAGQKLQDTTHFTWRANNISAYKTLTHQHLKEINRSLKQLQPAFAAPINFIPWRGDFTRGIFVSSVITTDRSLEELKKLYQDFYAGHPFAVVTDGTVDLKQVVNTNKCLIGLEKEGDKVVVHTAIDNLLKGASGQAVQNMNLMFGLEETTGVRLKSIVF